MFLSQRPNNDPLPWVDHWGSRIHLPGEDTIAASFDPRPEFTQTRDPKPWETDYYGDGVKLRTQFPHNREVSAWAPRHEEFDTPVNPILSLFRKELKNPSHPSIPTEPKLLAGRWLRRLDYLSNPHEETDHARRVLSKLVAVYSE